MNNSIIVAEVEEKNTKKGGNVDNCFRGKCRKGFVKTLISIRVVIKRLEFNLGNRRS